MPSYTARALVLRKTKLGETDAIITLLSDEGIQIRAVAKGVRRPGSKFGGRLEPYAIVDAMLHTGRNLDVVTEVRTVESNTALREDLDRSSAAAVVADLLDKVSAEGQTERVLFALGSATLSALAGTGPSVAPALVTAFLIKALALHGYRPELEDCAACAGELAGSSSLSLEHGGVVCASCGELDPAVLQCPPQARAWLLKLLHSTLAEISRAEIPKEAVSDCFQLVRAFVNYHVPTKLKALDYYAGFVSAA